MRKDLVWPVCVLREAVAVSLLEFAQILPRLSMFVFVRRKLIKCPKALQQRSEQSPRPNAVELGPALGENRDLSVARAGHGTEVVQQPEVT